MVETAVEAASAESDAQWCSVLPFTKKTHAITKKKHGVPAVRRAHTPGGRGAD